MEMDIEKFNSVFSDSEFVNKILNAETGEKVKWLLKEKNLILKDEDLDFFAAALIKSIESKYKETLNAENLENVSGGSQNFVDNYKTLEKLKSENVITWFDFGKIQI
ncbi:MAG: hypothetical protein IJG00_00955 [Clostridia bacterium]|nr:hypothetical protein [Clostridia bacterium]